MGLHKGTAGRARRTAANALIATALVAAAGIATGIGSAAISSPAAGAAEAHVTRLTVSQTSVDFGFQRVGTVGAFHTVRLSNNGATPITLKGISFQSGNRTDFIVGTGCFPDGTHPVTIAPGDNCTITLRFVPRARTTRTAILRIDDSTAASPESVKLHGVGTEGYYIVGVRGGVAFFGDARPHGDLLAHPLSAPIISLTSTPTGAGYWMLGRDGGIFAFGDAKFFGSTGAMHLNQPVLAMATTTSGNGYWLVAGDGGIFTFGKARFFGSTGAMHLNQPIVGMASTPSGKGYWLVARDGGIFAFGDAKFVGSTGGGAFGTMNGMAITSDGGGYWLSNTVGQIFSFGNAPYYGDIYRRINVVLAGVSASAPKLRPPGFAGTVLYIKHGGSQAAATLPLGVPRLETGG